MTSFFYKQLVIPCLLIVGLTGSVNVLAQKAGHSYSSGQDATMAVSVEKPDLFKKEWKPAISAYSKEVRGGAILDFETQKVSNFIQQNPEEFSLELPTGKGNESLTVKLQRSNIFAAGFQVFTSSNPGIPHNLNLGLHYHGYVEGVDHSLAAISVFDDEVMGLVITHEGSYNLGKIKNESQKHIFYLDSDLIDSPILNCETVHDFEGYTLEEVSSSPRAAGDCVRIYIEADQTMFNGMGSVNAVTNLLIGVFNQSAILYANESIIVAISEIFVWTTPDPYNGPTAAQYRAQFQANTGAFNGDLGHLVALDNVGGQAAGFAGLCNADTDESLCFSGFSGTGFNNVPTYSFNVYIFTHELGHLFGSRHTHACVWNGDNTAIDGCAGFTEGDCDIPGNPAGGGTIMSYCNSTGVGVNFNLGFGPQPGNVIRNRVANASCLSSGCPCDLAITNVSVTPEICPNANDGSITITATTGNGPLTYSITGPVNQSNNTGVFTGLPDGNYTISVSDDGVPNCVEASAAFIAAGVDNTPPSITCPANISEPYDPATCTDIAVPDPLTSDNCGILSVTWEMTGATEGSSLLSGINYLGTQQFNFGLTTVNYYIMDVNGNSASCSFTVEVTPAVTTSEISVAPDPQQYSDMVTFTATITGGASGANCSSQWQAAESATFYLGAQEMGSADFVVSGTDLVATLSDICLLEGVIGQMSPGIKTVTAEFFGIDDVHFIVSQPDPISFEITPEDAVVEYNGQEYFSTPSASNCTGTITLMAYIGDVDDTPGNCRGDIRNATLTFSNGGIPGTILSVPDLPVGLINPGEFQEGVAVTDFMHTLTGGNCSSGGETFEVWVSAGGYYTGATSDLTLVTLALPGSEFVTGGGHVVLGNNSAGTYAGTSGSKMNFGFNMKWNPSGRNLQGNINVIFRRYVNGEWKKYQIRSNKINSMAVNLSDPNYKKAIISTKATLRDITDPLNPVSLGGNLNLAMDAYESTLVSNGSMDKIVVTLSGNGGQGILFSSQWIGTGPVAQIINGGKIHVRSNGPSGKSNISADDFAKSEQASMEVKIRPNPFDNQTTIEFELAETLESRLEIRDNSGRIVAVLFNGVLQSGQHSFTFDASGLSNGVYYYKLISGNDVRSGKIIKM
ncbi:MAG: hypothetical protein CVT94_15715 [Bacteroidetes bacterium HGW-Bacteroidetes-11]|nr:MAG: hypothetical protein CVT94_15715 [Bacteroidetes bacterium HGW-Bacteroidetes-11]